MDDRDLLDQDTLRPAEPGTKDTVPTAAYRYAAKLQAQLSARNDTVPFLEWSEEELAVGSGISRVSDEVKAMEPMFAQRVVVQTERSPHREPRATDYPPREPRFRVHFPVCYEVDGVPFLETIENVSQGGLFIRTARGLKVGAVIDLHLDLPGFGACSATARVVHRRKGASPGAGLRFESTHDITENLWDYLFVLSSRADYAVLVTDPRWCNPLIEAGYNVLEAFDPTLVSGVLAASARRVVGVQVSTGTRGRITVEADKVDAAQLVQCMDSMRDFENMLTVLDHNIRVQAMSGTPI